MWSANPTYTHRFVKENLLLAHRPVSSFSGLTITGGIGNADDAVRAFGDSYDDTADGSTFFSQGGTGQRWAVAQNGSSRCDLSVRLFDTLDRVAEVRFFDRTEDPGAYWSFASYKASYVPDGRPQTLKIRVSTVDGSTFFGKRGRIAVGFIGREVLSNPTCPETGLTYGQHSFTASIVGGVQLDDATPFWQTNPPLTVKNYASVPTITTLRRMTIAMKFTVGDFTLTILNSDTGAQLFTVTEPYPEWNWSEQGFSA